MASPSFGRTLVLTLLTLVAFAGNSILCRLALQDGAIDPVAFAALRLASGALVLAPFLRRGAEAPSGRPSSVAASTALFVYALGFSLAYVTLEAGTGALLLFGAVQVTMIGAALRQGERPTPLRTFGIALALLGLVLLVLPGVSAPNPRGALLMSVAGIAWGVYSLLGRRAAAPTTATAWNFLLAVPPAAFFMLAASSSVSISGSGALLAIASGAITSGLGYVLWYAALPGHSATSASVVQLAVPVLAALGGVAVLGEQPGARLLGAGSLTLGGVSLAVIARRVDS